MITDIMRTTTLLTLTAMLAGGALAGCSAAGEQPGDTEVAGYSAEFRDSDGDGHDDYLDTWRFSGSNSSSNSITSRAAATTATAAPTAALAVTRSNICPTVQAFAFPETIKVGQLTVLRGYATDTDGPRTMRFEWTVLPTTIGKIVTPTSKRSDFKCLQPGAAHLTFSATDGACTRLATLQVYCNSTTAPVCGNGKVETGELCDGNCPTSCTDTNACTADKLTGSAATCNATCTHTAINTCTAGDTCCPTNCTPSTDSDCRLPCGNGVIDPGETCDGNCPTSCNDNNACTTDTLTGSAATCNVTCGHAPVSTCTTGDGCCPSSCSRPSDTDCSMKCGDGITDPGETCDGNCPTSCNDNNACTTDALTGTPAQCNVACVSAPLAVCTSGDGCCPTGCARPNDMDCPARCGDGVVDPGESCDGNCKTSCNDSNACTTDVLTGSANLCNVTCTNTAISVCSASADSCCDRSRCNSNNDVDCSPSCGNNIVEAGETCDGDCPASCDDGNACTRDTRTGTPAQCNVACTHASITTCTTGDGCCAAGCKNSNDKDCPYTPECGNGIVDPNETCDGNCPSTCNDNDPCTTDVTSGSALMCTLTCTHSDISVCSAPTGDQCCPSNCNANNDVDCRIKCGNGVVESTETCDGNCPADCDDQDPCTDDITTGSAATCNISCHHTQKTTIECTCGNGSLDSGELCDGNCPTPSSCDDSNPCTTDSLSGSAGTCDARCVNAPIPGCTQCGNGIIEAGETCDGNCPTSCPVSANACWPSMLTGSPIACNVKCETKPVTTCTSGDGCCPTAVSCGPGTDAECISDPCSVCESQINNGNYNCPDATDLIDYLAGVDANGTRLKVLARAALNCFHDKHCARNAVTDCFCGAGVEPDACWKGTLAEATGPCKDEVIAAAQTSATASTVMGDVQNRFFDTSLPIGAAASMIETCDQFFCAFECL